jgi:hypothetical protein
MPAGFELGIMCSLRMVFRIPKYVGAIYAIFIHEQLCAFSWFNKLTIIRHKKARNELP